MATKLNKIDSLYVFPKLPWQSPRDKGFIYTFGSWHINYSSLYTYHFPYISSNVAVLLK